MLRPATAQDIPFVLACERAPHARDFVVAGTAAEHARALADPDLELLLVLSGGRAAGFVLLAGLNGTPGGAVELRRTVVDPPGRGLGQFALDAAVARALEVHGAGSVWLDVVPDNERARALYAKAGFTQDGVLTDGVSMGGRTHPLVVLSRPG